MDRRWIAAIGRDFASAGWPLAVALLSTAALDVADTGLLARLGAEDFAAFGLASAVFAAVDAVFAGIIEGVRVSTSLQGGSTESGDRAAIALALALGVAVAALCQGAEPILRLLGAEPELMRRAAAYLAVRGLASPFWYAALAAVYALQARGRGAPAMRIYVESNLIFAAAEALLIFGWGPIPALGLQGAAWAWVISSVAASAMALTRLRGGSTAKGSRPPQPSLEIWSQWREILKHGLPMGLGNASDLLGFAAMAVILAREGQGQLFEHQVALAVVGLASMAGGCLGDTAGLVAGKHARGAAAEASPSRTKHRKRAMAAVLALTAGLALGAGGLLAAALGWAGEATVALWLGSGSLGSLWPLVLFAVGVAPAVLALHGALQGMGLANFAAGGSAAAFWGLGLPLGWTLASPAGLGTRGMWIGLAVCFVAQGLVLAWKAHRWVMAASLDSAGEPALGEASGLGPFNREVPATVRSIPRFKLLIHQSVNRGGSDLPVRRFTGALQRWSRRRLDGEDP